MNLRTCVAPSGEFIYGIHRPCFRVDNLRSHDYIRNVGWFMDGTPMDNRANFPESFVDEPKADAIYEIPNPFPFRGVTYIAKSWADEQAKHLESINLPPQQAMSFAETIRQWQDGNNLTPEKLQTILQGLPDPVRLAVAGASTDSRDLVCLAKISCDFVYDPDGTRPIGVKFKSDAEGVGRPVIRDHLLYEIVSNNSHLPDEYKKVMVLRPGVQGRSEIVGEWADDTAESHIFEYLRRNSYIPWGHYAANMAHDSVRYRISDLSLKDMFGLRHLYYQRTYVRMATELGIPIPGRREMIPVEELETIRRRIMDVLPVSVKAQELKYNHTLWGWNFGFDYAPSKYRLHASHQQVHQQFALIPSKASAANGSYFNQDAGEPFTAYACGDLVTEFIGEYVRQTGTHFFDAYIKAIRNNRRFDEKNKESSLIIYSDPRVILFAPKAQTSQWEIQLMALKPVGNILEADMQTRQSMDTAMLIAVRILSQMGAKMITVIEYSKAFDSESADQRLLYSFLPRLPESPGAFSEAQLRWINGHYPEDFAAACRIQLPQAKLLSGISE